MAPDVSATSRKDTIAIQYSHDGTTLVNFFQAFLTKTNHFFSESITSTLLVFVIFALQDETNRGAMGKTGAGPLFPLALFLLIVGLGACSGYETVC